MPTTQSDPSSLALSLATRHARGCSGQRDDNAVTLNVNSGSDYLRSHAIHFSLFFEAVLFLLLVVWIRTNRAGGMRPQSSLLPFWRSHWLAL
jgi:hypothetical protein